MKVTFPRKEYFRRVEKLKEALYEKLLLYSVVAALISLLFSFYTLMPLRRALRLNEEFVKDILHDFNTPISSMRINLKLFKREIGENRKIERLENNIETILSLQNNLQIFLKGISTQSERFDLKELLESRIKYFRILYPDIDYTITMESTKLESNKDALTRILDNLLSNAGKYNREERYRVSITMQKQTSLDSRYRQRDSEHPSKVFDRYYKEQERGNRDRAPYRQKTL